MEDNHLVDHPPHYQGDVRKRMMLIGSIVLTACIIVVILALTVPSSRQGSQEQPPLFWSTPEEPSTPSDLTEEPVPAPAIPCVYNEVEPQQCQHRVVPCGSTHVSSNIEVIPPDQNTICVRPKNRIYFGQEYLVQFLNGANREECWEILMQVGECWGINPLTGSDYTCMGKCGPGCGNINCGAWARDCLRHDVCSWYYGSSGAFTDANCAYAFWLAADDFNTNCLCGATNGTDKSICSKWN